MQKNTLHTRAEEMSSEDYFKYVERCKNLIVHKCIELLRLKNIPVSEEKKKDLQWRVDEYIEQGEDVFGGQRTINIDLVAADIVYIYGESFIEQGARYIAWVINKLLQRK